MRRTRILRYDRNEAPLGEIRDYSEAMHERGIDGTDGLTLTCLEDVSKGDHVSWADPDTGSAFRHTVVSCVRKHTMTGPPVTEARCAGDLCELFSSDVAARSFASTPLRSIVGYLLYGSRFGYSAIEAGPAYGFDYQSYDSAAGSGTEARYAFDFEDTSAREALAKVAEHLGAEIGVTGHDYATGSQGTIRLYRRYGIAGQSDAAVRARFTYGHNVSSVSREVLSDEVYTAVRAVGRDGITDTVYSASALESWGLPPLYSQGGKRHRVGRYSNTSCETLSQLRSEATTHLSKVCQPQVTYTFDLEEPGALDLGDIVQVSDPTFVPAIALEGRITRVRKDLSRERSSAQVVVGTTPPMFLEVAFKSIANSSAHRRT